MSWYAGVIAALALALAYDLYLRVRALRRERELRRTTGLTWNENRQDFYALAASEFERGRRYSHPFTLGYFDVDDYEEVHGRFGHVPAEGMVRLVVESARGSIRASDVVARLGGDAFGLLLPEAGPEAVGAVIGKLQDTVRAASRETALPLSISGGVVTCLQPAESLEAAVGAADRLLTGARGAGPDTFWTEVIVPQPLEGFEPARLRRPLRMPPGFDMPMPPLVRGDGRS